MLLCYSRLTKRFIFELAVKFSTVMILLGGLTMSAAERRKALIAYVFPQDRVLVSNEIAADKLTRINYAFANVKKGELVQGFAHDAENLRTLTGLRTQYPQLQILISVGGWSWSGGFSDLALTNDSRSKFIDTAVTFIREHSLDGIDIDWEYPGAAGAGNKHRPEDKTNFTALLKDLRTRLDLEGHRLGRPLLLSIAAGASEEFIANTELRIVQRYLDSVNLMSYDYYVPSVDHITGHHAPLLANPADPKYVSAERSIKLFKTAGVSAEKLVLGVPFYGRMWSHVDDRNHGLFQHGKKVDAEPDYKKILDLLSGSTYIRHWDHTAKAPYLYSTKDRTFVTYEDPESLRWKTEFVLEHHLAGIMFWEYSNDFEGTLLNAIYKQMNAASK